MRTQLLVLFVAMLQALLPAQQSTQSKIPKGPEAQEHSDTKNAQHKADAAPQYSPPPTAAGASGPVQPTSDAKAKEPKKALAYLKDLFDTLKIFTDVVTPWILAAIGYCGVKAALRTLGAIKEQGKIANSTLVLTHRPKLVVRHVIIIEPNRGMRFNAKRAGEFPFAAEKTVMARLQVVNIGSSMATVTNSYRRIYVGGAPQGLPMEPPYEVPPGSAFLESQLELKPGQATAGNFCGAGPSLQQIQHHYAGKRKGGQSLSIPETDQIGLYVLGFVDYTDELGLSRRTAFCRWYVEATDRFVPVNDPDYEFTD
ncbi:MAG: hypothetical protein ABSH50_31795 [Bryobacteraceae bacterium]